MENIYNALLEKKETRSSLSALRAAIKEDTGVKHELHEFIRAHEELFFGFLEDEDAKTRKNAALLLGDVFYQKAASALYQAYKNEKTLFVRSSYLDALNHMDIGEWIFDFKNDLKKLRSEEITEENRKHVENEIRSLHRLIISYEGITEHTFLTKQTGNRILLTADKNQRELVKQKTGGKVHPLGVITKTDNLSSVLDVRTYRELLFPVPVKELLDTEPEHAAAVWKSMLALCEKYHEEEAPFYFRIECRPKKTLEETSVFAKRLGAEIEKLSSGMLVNSTSDYEVELRLYADRTGRFFPALKFSALPDRRFSYRKNAVSASIHPSTAAQIMELAAPHLKKNAKILDPFCGVGTLLIERDLLVPARELCGTDIFGTAIEGAKENAALAGEDIRFIRRDFFEFSHPEQFDEIITNMPVRGKMTREEHDAFYGEFFEKVLHHLAPQSVIVLYTNELGFVKKQLRLHKEFTLLKEHCMQERTGFYLLVIGVRNHER